MIGLSIEILDLIWFIFLVYWTIAILYEKLTKKRKSMKKRVSLPILLVNRLLIYAALFLIFITPYYRQDFPFVLRIFPNSFIITSIGIVLTFIGIFFAIWARFTLGGNWSGDATFKKEQNLIKNGPYNMVRHPIYTGLTVAVIGSAITENALIVSISIFFILIFSFFRIKDEEKQLMEEFGKDYENYTKKVKTFVPKIL